MNFLGAQHRMSTKPSGLPFIRLWLMVVGVLPFIVLDAGLRSGFAQSEITDVFARACREIYHRRLRQVPPRGV